MKVSPFLEKKKKENRMAQIISLRIKQNSLEYVYNRAIPIYDVSIIPNFYRNISKKETYHVSLSSLASR